MTTLQEDMTMGDTLKQPERAENMAQTPMLVSSSTLANLLPQKAYSKTSGHGLDNREYQLSYGVESSMMSTSTAVEGSRGRQHATNKYGIMEDSYYEDGLNGNTPLEERDVLLSANRNLNEENRKMATRMRTAVTLEVKKAIIKAASENNNQTKLSARFQIPRGTMQGILKEKETIMKAIEEDSGYNLAEENSSGISSCCTSSSTNADHPTNRGVAGIVTGTAKHSNGPTHRVQFPFSPRHSEEIALEVGDAIKVERECEDHWCYGTNLRTTHHGIFPAAHVCEIDLVEEICQGILQANVQVPLKQDRDTFYLTMLASVEVGHHKGNDVLVQAINKICSVYQQKDEILIPQTVLMEVSFRGIHVIDKRKKDPTKYFFCGAHPKQLRYFGFITKHPLLPRFACHVFLSQESTQPIVEAIGRAFKRSYDEYMAFAHPTEDIFIE